MSNKDNSLPNDMYGRTVSMTTDGVTDTYTIDDSFTLAFPTGTDLAAVYNAINAQQPPGWIPPISASQAIQQVLQAFQSALEQFTQSHYDDNTRITFLVLLQQAQTNGLTNRAAYIAQALNWSTSVLTYAQGFVVAMQAQTDVATILATTWDFSNIAVDPGVTLLGAISINN